MKTLLLLSLLLPIFSFAGEFKIRAREHFDIHQFDRNGTTETYRGLSNTINIWYEKPFDISYGFSFNPIIGSASADNSDLPELGSRIRLFHVGAELKYFFLMEGLFSRFGAGWSQLRSYGPLENSDGYNGYVGLGWEFKIKKVGLALEIANRFTSLENDISVSTLTPSLGVHFYEHF